MDKISKVNQGCNNVCASIHEGNKGRSFPKKAEKNEQYHHAEGRHFRTNKERDNP